MDSFEKTDVARNKETWLTGNLCLSIETQGDLLKISIKNKAGQKYEVNDNLPEGWRIKQGTEKGTTRGKEGFGNPVHERAWTMESETKTFYFGEVLDAKDLLSIFHEMGHVKAIENSEYEEIMNLGREAHSARLGGYEEDILITNMAYSDAEAEMEIKCWKFAEKELKEVCQELGINPSEIFPTQEEMVNYINESLSTLSEKFQVNPFLEDENKEVINQKYLYR